MIMVTMVINTITKMKMGMIIKNMAMMIKMYDAFTWGFSEPPLWETAQAYSQPAMHLLSLAIYSKLFQHWHIIALLIWYSEGV